MSENLRWYTKALYGFDHVVRLGGDWDAPSPCEGWTARSVVGHVVAIQRYIESLVDAATPAMDPFTDPHRHAAEDPGSTWAATRDALLEKLDQPDVLHRVVNSFNGERPLDEVIGFNVQDTVVHSWDLARALGVDDRLDPTLVARATELLAPVADGMRNPVVFGAKVEAAPGADPQTALLALVGRKVD